jgi:hypothetical protein
MARGLQLSKEDRADLVAFLLTLTGDDPPVAIPPLPTRPSKNPVAGELRASR